MDMNQDYFEIKQLDGQAAFDNWREILASECFLLDYNREDVHLCRCLAQALFGDSAQPPAHVSITSLVEIFTPRSREIFLRDLERLREKRTTRTDSHLNMLRNGQAINFLVVTIPLPQPGLAVGICHINYDLMHEYDQRMEDVIQQLKHAQSVNQLILEGSTDYIYQLDLVNNVCTFSPKALDVLPLESPTFSNAMDRILGFIVPEDRKIFLESFTPFLSGKSDYHVAEYRVRTKQGDIMWISCHGKGLHDATGNPVMIAGSLMDITEKKRTEERMHQMLYFDELTGLKNRHCFEKEMPEFLARNPDATGSVLCIDIRNFKVFNEIFGHSFANTILKEFSRILQLYITDNLGLYRLEGDEFLVHLLESDPAAILEKLTPFQMYLSCPRLVEGHTIYVRARIGVAIYPMHGRTAEDLIQNANTALQLHSKSDSQQTVFFRSETTATLNKKYLLETELRKDIDNGMQHFRLVYQPVVEFRGDQPVWHGAEALLRYHNPKLPNLTQTELIETLEFSDMIIPVGRWVVDQAVRECARWHKMGLSAYINVNISAQQVSDANLVNHILACCRSAGLENRWVVCELTETSLIKSFEIANQFCQDLMKRGFGVALDDFGTGYSSFNYLRRLPISQIKVDREYVQHLETEEYHRIILRCLYDLSQTLHLALCVEGVENQQTVDLLRDMGVPMMQGFFFDRPLEAEVFRKEILHHAGGTQNGEEKNALPPADR